MEHTAKTLYRKFETDIHRNETARPRFLFLHSCICERFISFHDRSAYFAAENGWTDRWNKDLLCSAWSKMQYNEGAMIVVFFSILLQQGIKGQNSF
jgi:hypothetical protein